MSDLISRQTAIDAFERFIHELGIKDEPYNYGEMALSAQNVPSAENKGEPIESARTLKKHCINTKDCKECFMWDECKYELSAPCDWDLPDGEKGGEE